jgi:adenine-specific DNA-methyltransferase
MNMMFSRLLVARQLLRKDSVIFISIDDNEVHNLRRLCNEVFGEDNFVSQIPWQARQSIQNDIDISDSHEYIVVYAKNRRKENRRLKESNKKDWYNEETFAFFPKELDKSKFSNPDNDPRGDWKADPFDAPGVRANLMYEIVNPKTKEVFLPPNGRHWGTEEKNFKKLLQDNRILFGRTGESKPQVKVFYKEKVEFGTVIDTCLTAILMEQPQRELKLYKVYLMA